MHLQIRTMLKGSMLEQVTFPAKWSASRLSLSSRDRYAPQTSQTCSFDCDPLGSWFVRSSRCSRLAMDLEGLRLPPFLSFHVAAGLLDGTVAVP